ncbi:MAG: hypothetical protein Q8928_02605 [Bacteroidota bacterium]|nr:hypothetical protein [Bacteroidota bacterium]
MAKEIEIVSATDTQALKIQLQEMVNDGWEIKGVIGYNPHNIYSEPFIILERLVVEKSIEIEEENFSGDELINEELYFTRPEPHHQEISISMGGD